MPIAAGLASESARSHTRSLQERFDLNHDFFSSAHGRMLVTFCARVKIFCGFQQAIKSSVHFSTFRLRRAFCYTSKDSKARKNSLSTNIRNWALFHLQRRAKGDMGYRTRRLMHASGLGPACYVFTRATERGIAGRSIGFNDAKRMMTDVMGLLQGRLAR